jgi:hypothetical protein
MADERLDETPQSTLRVVEAIIGGVVVRLVMVLGVVVRPVGLPGHLALFAEPDRARPRRAWSVRQLYGTPQAVPVGRRTRR